MDKTMIKERHEKATEKALLTHL